MHATASESEYVPAAHCVQLGAPEESEYLPGAQELQDVEPSNEYLPAAQEAHDGDSAVLLYVPAAQFVHSPTPAVE